MSVRHSWRAQPLMNLKDIVAERLGIGAIVPLSDRHEFHCGAPDKDIRAEISGG